MTGRMWRAQVVALSVLVAWTLFLLPESSHACLRMWPGSAAAGDVPVGLRCIHQFNIFLYMFLSNMGVSIRHGHQGPRQVEAQQAGGRVQALMLTQPAPIDRSRLHC